MVYYVYILANKRNGTLYTGMTNDLGRRVNEHKSELNKGFTSRYGIKKLVYFEEYESAVSAIAREKQIKSGSRKAKIILIERDNSQWQDLSEGW